MAVRGICAGRRAEKRDGLAGFDAPRELVDGRRLGAHLRQVSLPVLRPGQGPSAPLAVERGEELGARPQLAAPLVPRFLSFRQPARPVAADEDAPAVVGLSRVVPAAGSQRHGWDVLPLDPFFCGRNTLE